MIDGNHTIWAKSTKSNHLISINGDVYTLGRRKGLLNINPGTGNKRYIGISHGPSVHRQVAILFIDNKLNKPEVNHKNGIHNDNRVENLEWVTASENALHSHRTLNRKYNNTPGGNATAKLRREGCILDNKTYIGQVFGNLLVIGQNEATLRLICVCQCSHNKGKSKEYDRKFIIPSIDYKKIKGCAKCIWERKRKEL